MNNYFLKSDIDEILEGIAVNVNNFSGKTIVLTGAMGFLGRYFMEIFSRLNESILEKPCKVIAVDNLIIGNGNFSVTNKNRYIKVVNHDVIEPFSYEEKIDYIIHAAGIASPFYYSAHPLETIDVATIGTRKLLDLAKKNNARFIFFSSSEIYGDPDPNHVPIQESYRGNVATMGPRACYDESKRLAETLCYIYQSIHGVSTNIIRPFNVYGPGMQEEDYRLMPNFASLIKADQPVHVYGDGDQTRTFSYVTDALTGFIKVISEGVPGEAYNIGNPEPEVSVMDVLHYIEKVIGNKIEFLLMEHPDSYPADEPMRRCPDIRKAMLQLSYRPVVSLEDGLQRYFSWADKVYTGKLYDGQ